MGENNLCRFYVFVSSIFMMLVVFLIAVISANNNKGIVRIK